MQNKRIPPVVLAYGLAGLIPFLAPPLLSLAAPELARQAGWWQAVYAAVILSFLGGARWGQAVRAPGPDAVTVSLAMLPSLFGWTAVLLVAEIGLARVAMALAAGLALQWLWDVRSGDLPGWYPRLRSILTVGAVTGLLAEAALL